MRQIHRILLGALILAGIFTPACVLAFRAGPLAHFCAEPFLFPVPDYIWHQHSGTYTGRNFAFSSTLENIQYKLELYNLDHGNYPPVAEMEHWQVMLLATDAAGHPDPNSKFGPYVATPPSNPLTGLSRVVPTGHPDRNAGWTYDPRTGEIRGVVPDRTITRSEFDFMRGHFEFALNDQ